MKTPPDEVKLSREEGEALIERLRTNALTSEDRGLLVKLIQLYFWFTFALRETKISLGRLKRALFGEGRRPPPPTVGGEAMAGADAGSTAAGSATPATGSTAPIEDSADAPAAAPPARRRGHGRRGADAYPGAERVVCRHETLAAGQRCPACGRGTLYPLPAGVEIRIDDVLPASLLDYNKFTVEPNPIQPVA